MSFIANVAQPANVMNSIPGVGRVICIAAALQKSYCAWQNFRTLEDISKNGRTETRDRVLERTEKVISKFPWVDRFAKSVFSDSSRSIVYNLKPFGENLGWVLLLTGCATNAIPGTATAGLLFSLYARPWTTLVRGTQWPLLGGCLLWTVIFAKEPLYKLIPLVAQVARPLL
jgi:hypothetical protein